MKPIMSTFNQIWKPLFFFVFFFNLQNIKNHNDIEQSINLIKSFYLYINNKFNSNIDNNNFVAKHDIALKNEIWTLDAYLYYLTK